MTLSSLADIAGLLAALGVIASLLFVAFELRRTGPDTRQANRRQLLDGYREFKGLTNDREFAAFAIRARQDHDALDPAEQLSFEHYQEQGIHVMANFYKHAASVPGELEGLERAVDRCIFDHLGGPGARSRYAQDKRLGRLMPGTYARVERIVARFDAQGASSEGETKA